MTSGERAPRRWAAMFSAAVVALPFAAAEHPAAAERPAAAGHVPAAAHAAPPRALTLYTSGTSTSPPTNFNPLDPASYTGASGLLYEPLFLYDPVHGRFIPWLASSGTWATPTTYRLQVRHDMDWVSSATGAVDGTVAGNDIAYSIALAMKDPADPYHADVASVVSTTVDAGTVTVKFAKPVGYAQWQQYLWHAPVLPAAVWSKLAAGTQATAANTAPVSSGPMLLDSVSPTQACYRDNAHWWGTAQLRLSFKFEYLCDVVSGSSGTDLSQLLDGHIDWSNQLLRGITNLADSKAGGYGIKTYYPGQPYMLAASTAWLQMDVAKAPMSNVDFRRAVAYAVDPAAIASGVYTGAVQVANPTGLLPELSAFVDKNVAHKYGFYYSPTLARHYLADSGYKGQQLQLMVPQGWSDLDDAAALLGQQLGKVGIKVSVHAVPLATRNTDVANGDYDMVINFDPGVASTPWEYFNAIYQLPLGPEQRQGANTERFSAPADWALVQEAAGTPLTDTTALDGIYANLELDFLQQLPEIPLWYAGAWFEASTAHWQDYPSNMSGKDQYTPVMWAGWLGSTTTVLALAQLEPH